MRNLWTLEQNIFSSLARRATECQSWMRTESTAYLVDLISPMGTPRGNGIAPGFVILLYMFLTETHGSCNVV